MNEKKLFWKPDTFHPGWESLEIKKPITFREFVDYILSDSTTHGCIYVYGFNEDDLPMTNFQTMTYQFGKITWLMDDILNRIDNWIIVDDQKHGMDHHTKIRRPNYE